MFNSLRVQAMVILFLICLLIALILSGFWYNNAQDCIKSDVQLSSRLDSRHVADQVGAYIERNEAYAITVAIDPNTVDGIISKDQDKLKLMADRLQASVPRAEIIQMADNGGDIIYSTRPSNITNLGTYTWYGMAANRSEPSVTGLYYSSISSKDVFSILSPIKGNGTIIGYVVLAFTPDVLRNSTQGIDAMKNVLIIDNSGKVISRDNRTKVEPHTNVSAYTPIQKVLRGEEGVIEHDDAWDGQRRVSAFTPVSDTGWAAMVSEPAAIAYRPIRDQLFLILGVLALLALGFSTFSFYASKRLSDPIVELRDKAKKAYSGNYDVKLDVSREDEIGDLARTFNDLRAELKTRNESLTDERERFQALVRDLPVGIMLIGAHGEYAGSNSAMLNMLGISEDQLEGKTIFDKNWVLWDRFRDTGKAISREAHPILVAYATRQPVKNVPVEVYRPAPGGTVWLSLSAEPQLAEDGSVKGMICTFVDVTERRLLEEALALAKYSLDEAPEEIFWITSEGRFYYANDAACNALGYTRDQLLSMGLWDIDTSFTHENWPIRWKEFKEAGSARLLTMHLTSDHKTFPVDAMIRYIEFHGSEYIYMFARNITELKQARDALLSANADLARSQEAAHLGSYVWNVTTGEAMLSNELYGIFGMEPGEGTASIEEYMSRVHPDDKKIVDEAVNEALLGRKFFGVDHRLMLRDGSVHYVHSAGEVMFDQAGKAVQVYGTIQDITVRKLIEIERDDLERQLSSGRARLEAVLRNIPAGIVIAEAPSGRIIMANKQMEEIFRHEFPFSSSLEEYGEWGVFQSSGQRYEPENFPLARSIRNGEVVSEEEVSFLRGDGTWGLVSINSAPIYDSKGHIVDAIATFFDITERRKAENALRESESNLARAQLIAHLGNWVWNIEKNEMRYSEEMCRIYGIVLDKYGSTFEAFISLVRQEDREPVRRSINAALNRKEPHSIDFRIIRPDGVERFVHSEGEVIFDEAGKPVRMFGTVQDISDRKQVEGALLDAKRQAELYLDLMSHDINNMNMIGMGYLELALEKLKLDEEGRLLLQKPLEVLKNSSMLIDNVRKTRRAVTGELGLSRIDVGQMLEQITDTYEKAPLEGVLIQYNPTKDHFVMANELLKDVFTNLIDNAIKHSGKPVVIFISLSRASEGGREYNKISIEDNGPGIPDDLKDKIFNRMSRGDTKARGSGLGLYLVKTLVESYNGKVWVENRVPGDYKKGSKFVVLLPAIE